MYISPISWGDKFSIPKKAINNNQTLVFLSKKVPKDEFSKDKSRAAFKAKTLREYARIEFERAGSVLDADCFLGFKDTYIGKKPEKIYLPLNPETAQKAFVQYYHNSEKTVVFDSSDLEISRIEIYDKKSHKCNILLFDENQQLEKIISGIKKRLFSNKESADEVILYDRDGAVTDYYKGVILKDRIGNIEKAKTHISF